MEVKVGDAFANIERNTYLQVIEIIDENYCICIIKDFKGTDNYGNWKQSIANIVSSCNRGFFKKLTEAEKVLYGPVPS